jgi:hypothetical protein
VASDYAGITSNTEPGTNEFLKGGKSHFIPLTAHSNKVQAGQLPRTQSAKAGAPNHQNPLGAGSSRSLNG